MFTERRRYIRFLPTVNAFAALGVGFSKIGKIINISIGGLSFGYLSQIEKFNNDPMLNNIYSDRTIDFFYIKWED